MAVYAVRWNKFHPRIFLSASADWSVPLIDSCLPPLLSLSTHRRHNGTAFVVLTTLHTQVW